MKTKLVIVLSGFLLCITTWVNADIAPADIVAAWYGVDGGKNTGSYKGKSVVEIIQSKMLKNGGIGAPAESFNDLFGDPIPGMVKVVAIAVKKDGLMVHLRFLENVDKNFVWKWHDTEKFDPSKNKAGIIGADEAYFKDTASTSIPASAPVAATVQSAPPPPTVKVDVVVAKIDPDKPPVMEIKKADPSQWKLEEPVKNAKPIQAVLMDKGAGKDALIIKMVSVCDRNNVWCVANDGSKDGVYQLTSKGLAHKFDGVYVSAGKEIVSAINDKQEVFELEGGSGNTWKKVEGSKLSRISRPSHDVGWGLLEAGKGVFSCFTYNDVAKKWEGLKDSQGQDVKGIVDLSANAEAIVLALTDKGQLLKGDLNNVELQNAVKEAKKYGAKGAHGVKKAAHDAKKAGKKVKHPGKKHAAIQ